jgi:MoxR-like ATPase
LRQVYQHLGDELKKIIVGQEQVIEQLAICIFARGHALLMGVPGLAKTLLISRLAETMSLTCFLPGAAIKLGSHARSVFVEGYGTL